MGSIIDAAGLLKALTTWITGLLPVAGGLMIGYHALMRNAASDDKAAAQHTNAMRSVALGAGIGTAGTAVITYLLTYIHP